MIASSRTPSISSSPEYLALTPKEKVPESDTSLSDIEEVTFQGHLKPVLHSKIPELFSQNICAKIIRTASRGLENPQVFNKATGEILGFPETVPQDGPNAGQYEFRDPDFWTCGFFPGSLFAVLERSIKHPHLMSLQTSVSYSEVDKVRSKLRSLSKLWSTPVHDMAFRKDTHDIGFIVMPALKREWELTGDEKSLQSIVQAARSLATRYVPSAGAIRSWDCLIKKEITVTDMSDNLLVIVDSLCNLDLLYYASAHTGNNTLAEMATAHAHTLLHTHLRPEAVKGRGYKGQLYSTCHVSNLEPSSGALKWRWTAQGYNNQSTWARGQAWAILGYAQTYMWTKDATFLEAACGAAEYFLHRLEAAPSCVEIENDRLLNGEPAQRKGRNVPLWDFDAPVDVVGPLRDSSAGVIAANGLLILSQALTSVNQDALARHFLDAAINIVRDTIDLSLAPETVHFVCDNNEFGVEDCSQDSTFEGILKHGTANNNENARRRYQNHGLVYGDYYLIEFGNRLLDMGFV
ncbi:glycoside hydrolase family 88 protein [Aspergillus affinis]|uniref:glycoside hydrolase family 88 protein n=1 Tax=Aspergillus affinis TaxID=1070780 RepID=UPI0022FE82C7|nr:Six-hairpin glycosidase [Aspergillus affinis]KAI9036450.1 Six-hairpin glycosidase [Aspergillus affinis]